MIADVREGCVRNESRYLAHVGDEREDGVLVQMIATRSHPTLSTECEHRLSEEDAISSQD